MEEKIFDGSFFRGLDRVKLVTRITMQGGRSGMRKSAAKGSSVEFADFREYVPGDDIEGLTGTHMAGWINFLLNFL